MTEHSFRSYTEATMFAKQVAFENSKTVKIDRSGDVYIVCVDESITSGLTKQLTQQQRPARPVRYTTNSVSGKNASTDSIPDASRKKKKKKQKNAGLSAAAAKRSASTKNKKKIDPRSIFITNDIQPREISGGLPSLGKRK